MASYAPVTAVLRGLEVLRVVNRVGTATVKVIHHETGFDKATIVRMLETLIHAGYVTRDAEAATYGVTGRVLQLSAGFVHHDRIGEVCAPLLSRFRESIGWPSDFAIRDDEAMIVVRTSRDTGPLSFNRNPGFRAPILLTSVGKAYLAFCPEPERSEIISRLRETMPKNQMPSQRRVDAMLETVRNAGFAVMEEGYSQREYKGALWAMAVPVMDRHKLYGALNIMMLRKTVTFDDARERYLGALQTTAIDVASALRSAEL